MDKPKGISLEAYKAAQHEKKMNDMQYDLNQQANKLHEKHDNLTDVTFAFIREFKHHLFEHINESKKTFSDHLEAIMSLGKENEKCLSSYNSISEKLCHLQLDLYNYAEKKVIDQKFDCYDEIMQDLADAIKLNKLQMAHTEREITKKYKIEIKQAIEELKSIPSQLPSVEKFIHEQLGIISQDSLACRKRLSECEGFIKLLMLQLEHTKSQLRKIKGE